MNLEDYIKDLAPELQERARACGSVEELLALAKEAKIPVPDEALEAIAGGDAEPVGCGGLGKCPNCGSKDIKKAGCDGLYMYYKCNECGHKWERTINF